MKSDRIINASRSLLGINTDTALAKELGFVRQTLSHKKKYPGTFTAAEVLAMADLFGWSNDDIGEFIRGCKE